MPKTKADEYHWSQVQLTPASKVYDFHKAFGLAICEEHISDDTLQLRKSLIQEEAKETDESLYEYFLAGEAYGNKEAILKEMADLIYVVYGTAISFGWDLDEAVKLVHESNMSKLGEDGKPIYREDGKALKGPNYKAPDLSDLV